MKAKAVLYQVYKNIRPLIRNNISVRRELNLDTKDIGIYIPDVAFGVVDQMIQYCMFHGFTYKRCYAITNQLNDLELLIRDIMQYFSYFFRHDFKQKPDVMAATEKYKQMTDKLTLEKLREVVGKNNKIDFSNLGISHDVAEIEYNKEMNDYDEEKENPTYQVENDGEEIKDEDRG